MWSLSKKTTRNSPCTLAAHGTSMSGCPRTCCGACSLRESNSISPAALKKMQ
jgi:hypothetical protein